MKLVMTGIAAGVLLLGAQSCTTKAPQYVDLNTGTSFNLVKHPQTGLMVDEETGKPLNIYINTATRDTIDGRTGKIINGQVEKIDDSYFVYTDLQQGIPAIATGKVEDLPESDDVLQTP